MAAKKSAWEESFNWSSSRPPQFDYDVFLSFRGDDTRRNFTDNLYVALARRGFLTFRRDNELKRGEDIKPQLLKSIERSRLSVIVITRNYADSTWCLDELVKILECRETFAQMVLPVFYDVDPSDVRAQRGSFADAFAKHEERYKGSGMEGKLWSWRAALTEVSNLSGFSLQNLTDGCEYKIFEKMAEDISSKLRRLCLNISKYPVGIDSRVQHVNKLLFLESDEVLMIGICGIGGIGKTTIAKAIYNQIFLKFDGSSFLANVREISKQPNGLVLLQEQLLSDILMIENRNIRNVDQGIEIIRVSLNSRRVLIILDDVDQLGQLNALVIRRDFFHPGSRIILTTRDESLLKMMEVDAIYLPSLLSRDESFELFRFHAFGGVHPMGEYVGPSWEVVEYAEGLPLALEVFGSFLFAKTIHEWKSAVERLRAIPHPVIQENLRISFDSLDDEEKELFLDIACFFVGMDKNDAIKILEGCGYFTEIGLAVLSHRCLISIDGGLLTMHGMLRDMGREIVRRESPKEPGKRSRLWFHMDVFELLSCNTGTNLVEGLALNLPGSDVVKVNAKAFANMKRLRLLQLNYVHLSGSYEHLSKKLRWLCWFGFPLKYIPHDLFIDNVVVIDMRYSHMQQVWKGRKILTKLKILKLSHSYYLTETPDFSGCNRLEMLLLNSCIRLVKVHQSIECLEKLVVLDLNSCKSLRKLPLGIWKLESLENLCVSGCSNLEKLLGFKGSPASIWAFPVRIQGSVGSPPTRIQDLISLTRLDMANCNLSHVPTELGSLISLNWLNLEGNNFCSLPASISRLSQLMELYLCQCAMLQSLPELPVNLKILDARHCTSLERISIRSDFRRLPFLYFACCYKLVGIILASNFRCLLQNQELSAVGGFSILFPGGDVPGYFKYRSVKSVVSFVVPNRKIRWWILCVVIAGCEDDSVAAEPSAAIAYSFLYEVENKTRGVKKHYGPAFRDRPLYRKDHMWLHYAPPQHYLELKMEPGDVVEYSVFITDLTGIPVKKCGVDLVFEDDEENYPANDQAMIQYDSPSYCDVSGDEDVSTGQAVTDNMVVHHFYASVPFWMSICLIFLSVFVYRYLYII